MGEAEQGEADQECSGEWEKQSRKRQRRRAVENGRSRAGERQRRRAVENGRSRAGRGRSGMQWRMGVAEQEEAEKERSGEWEEQSRKRQRRRAVKNGRSSAGETQRMGAAENGRSRA